VFARLPPGTHIASRAKLPRMWRGLRLFLAGAFTCAVAIGAIYVMRSGRPPRAVDRPALIVQIRDVVRLETLDVTLYKKISFEPDPPSSNGFWKDVINWATFTIRPSAGRAIVFADVHLGFDLSRFDESGLRIEGHRAEVALPPIQATVELKPAETEVIGSNLDSAQTAQLFELARSAFEREALGDRKLRERARRSAERAIRALLFDVGVTEVMFVDALRPVAGSG